MENRESKIEYLSSEEKVIYFVEEEIELLKDLASHVANRFLDFEVMGFTNLEDLKTEMLERRPTVIISCIDFRTGNSIFPIIKEMRSKETTRNIPVILTGPRSRIEEKEELIAEYNCDVVPKAVRVPRLLTAVENGIKEASRVNFDTIKLDTGEILFGEGEQSHSIYILKSGILDIIKETEEGTKKIATLEGQQMVGEMAFLNGEKRSATVEARVPSEIIRLKLGDPATFIKEQPFWLGMLIETLIARVTEMGDKLADVLDHDEDEEDGDAA